MTKPIDIVLKLMDPNADHAKTIRDAWESDDEEFFIGLDMSTNRSLDFGIEKVPGLPEDDEEPGTLTFQQFYQLAMGLAHDKPSFDEASRAIEEAAMSANALEWNLWYRRILLKSLTKYLPMETIQTELIRLTSE